MRLGADLEGPQLTIADELVNGLVRQAEELRRALHEVELGAAEFGNLSLRLFEASEGIHAARRPLRHGDKLGRAATQTLGGGRGFQTVADVTRKPQIHRRRPSATSPASATRHAADTSAPTSTLRGR